MLCRVKQHSNVNLCFLQGILDIIVLSKGYSNKDFAIHTLKNNFEADAYFVKVIGKLSLYSQVKTGPWKECEYLSLCVW